VSATPAPPRDLSFVQTRPLRQRTALAPTPGGRETLTAWWRAVGGERLRRWLIAAALALTALTALLGAVGAWAWRSTPSTADLMGWVQAQVAQRRAPYTPLRAVAPVMVRALIAAEDERFYVHHGIDTLGLLRAAWDDARAGQFTEGGSTLTEQLAKNAYLGGFDHSAPLKLQDMALAVKVERRYSKDQILEMYLNLVYFGEGAYGVGAAAQRYFDVAPARLTLAQAALLAGLVNAPGYYDPWCHPAQARDRQGVVLERMREDGLIDAAQEAAARAKTFGFWLAGATPPSDAYCAP
jgi:membrane peptidoglycan carboxypeptidase